MKRTERTRFIITFLAPAVLTYAIFVILPLIQAFGFSVYRWKGISSQRKWVGLQNYTNALSDPAFRVTITNTFYLLIVVGIAVFIFAPAVATATTGKGPFAKFIRGVYLFPQVISMVVVAILWMFLLNPNYGLVNATLQLVGINVKQKSWLGDPSTALPSVAVVFIWYALGFYIMLFGAALQSVPEEVKEAAELDGASGFKKFIKVLWPMIWSIKRVAATYIVINVVNIFALVFLLTKGAPDRATEVPLTYLYEQAFGNSQFGYSSALAVLVFVMALMLSGIVMLIFRRDPMEPQRGSGR